MQKWADDTLKQVVSAFRFEQNDAVLHITEVKNCTGDAEVNIRKGKKLVTYDYNISLSWQLDLYDKEKSKVISKMTGIYELPEVSNDEEEDGWEVRIGFQDDKDKIKHVFEQMCRKLAADALKKAIMTGFVALLKAK